ncbi:hypothetical protein FA13DRAFT_1713810 [Coprinellus micaceus]|uniref:Uncharacterized protein n=1 Tax=Coprinellus micaceus TaxID=71717 RepID=A0A4Y7SVC1_COPMI|nr:hypothetical protein FA13DRAFT_1713810 [Coprinellus micaceus]
MSMWHAGWFFNPIHNSKLTTESSEGYRTHDSGHPPASFPRFKLVRRIPTKASMSFFQYYKVTRETLRSERHSRPSICHWVVRVGATSASSFRLPASPPPALCLAPRLLGSLSGHVFVAWRSRTLILELTPVIVPQSARPEPHMDLTNRYSPLTHWKHTSLYHRRNVEEGTTDIDPRLNALVMSLQIGLQLRGRFRDVVSISPHPQAPAYQLPECHAMPPPARRNRPLNHKMRRYMPPPPTASSGGVKEIRRIIWGGSATSKDKQIHPPVLRASNRRYYHNRGSIFDNDMLWREEVPKIDEKMHGHGKTQRNSFHCVTFHRATSSSCDQDTLAKRPTIPSLHRPRQSFAYFIPWVAGIQPELGLKVDSPPQNARTALQSPSVGWWEDPRDLEAKVAKKPQYAQATMKPKGLSSVLIRLFDALPNKRHDKRWLLLPNVHQQHATAFWGDPYPWNRPGRKPRWFRLAWTFKSVWSGGGLRVPSKPGSYGAATYLLHVLRWHGKSLDPSGSWASALSKEFTQTAFNRYHDVPLGPQRAEQSNGHDMSCRRAELIKRNSFLWRDLYIANWLSQNHHHVLEAKRQAGYHKAVPSLRSRRLLQF